MIKVDGWYMTDRQTGRQIGDGFRPGIPTHLRLTSNSVQHSCLVITCICPSHMEMIPEYLQSFSKVIIKSSKLILTLL